MNDLTQGNNLAKNGKPWPLALIVPESKSTAFDLVAGNFAQAALHREIPVGRARFHALGFTRDPEQLVAAYTIANFARNWRGFEARIFGVPDPGAKSTMGVLLCLIESIAARTQKNHCEMELSEPIQRGLRIDFDVSRFGMDLPRASSVAKSKKRVKYRIPCRRVYYAMDRLLINEPSQLKEHVLDVSARERCGLCPHFKIERFGRV